MRAPRVCSAPVGDPNPQVRRLEATLATAKHRLEGAGALRAELDGSEGRCTAYMARALAAEGQAKQLPEVVPQLAYLLFAPTYLPTCSLFYYCCYSRSACS